jgi:hypothetical protein
MNFVINLPETKTFKDAPGKYDKMTFWEQIDENVMFSPTKKRFLIIPLFLFVFIFFLNIFSELLSQFGQTVQLFQFI